MKDKRGQITVFIVIGVILVLSLSAMIFFRSQSIEEKGEEEVARAAQEIPYNMQRVNQFVKNCAEDVAKEGIRAIGAHGGYIDPLDAELSGTIMRIGEAQTESDALKMGELVVPYWNHLRSPNECISNCNFDSKMPNLYKSEGEPSIEGQIDRYLQRELPNCIDNFTELRELGFEVLSEGNIESSTLFSIADASITLQYPLQVAKGDERYDLNEFTVDVPVSVKQVYDLAKELTKVEQEDNYLEKHTLNTIAAFSQVNADKLPPMASTDFDCDKRVTWVRSDVEENKLKPVLLSHTSLLQPFGVSNYRSYDEITDPTTRGILTQALIPFNGSVSAGFDVDFDYLGWPVYLQITPNTGEIIEPMTAEASVFDFCVNQYKFAYDLSYPVLVTIRDPLAFAGEGYNFNFALETNIRANEILTQNSTIQELRQEFNYYDDGFLCNTNQRTSGNVTVMIDDTRTDLPVEGVRVKFCVPDGDGACGFDSCFMGLTGGDGKLTTEFPSADGIVLFTKEGYYDFAGALATRPGEETSYNASIHPIREKTVDVQLLLMKEKCNEEMSFVSSSNKVAEVVDVVEEEVTCMWEFMPSQTTTLGDEDEVIINLERVTPSYSTFLSTVRLEKGSAETVKLIPGDYSVNVMYLNGDGISIPERDLDCDGCGGLDAIEIDSIVLGGATLNNETGYWTLTQEELDSGNNVVFKAIVADATQIDKHEDLIISGLVENTSMKFTEHIIPEIR